MPYSRRRSFRRKARIDKSIVATSVTLSPNTQGDQQIYLATYPCKISGLRFSLNAPEPCLVVCMVVRDGNTVPVLSPGTPGQMLHRNRTCSLRNSSILTQAPPKSQSRLLACCNNTMTQYIMTYSAGQCTLHRSRSLSLDQIRMSTAATHRSTKTSVVVW